MRELKRSRKLEGTYTDVKKDVGRGYYESKGKRSRNEASDKVNLFDTLCDDYFDNCSRLKKLSDDYPVIIYSYKNNSHLLIIVSKLSNSRVSIQEVSVGRDDIYTETFDENSTSEFEKAISYARDLCK